MDSIISTDENYSRIIITIWNGDRDPYRYELYGDKITVERYIKRGGGGGYKLKDENNKTVSTSRSDLDLLIEHYNIQVNNP